MEDMEMKRDFWKDKRVLITGHKGFVGSWLAKTLVESGSQVIGIDKVKSRPISILNGSRERIISVKGNIVNLNLVKNIIDKYRPEFIFHLAAEAIVGKANAVPIKTFKSNVQGTWNILEASRGKGFIQGVIIASSDKAYGSHKKLPYKEGTPLKGEHPYDVSKSCADLIAYSYWHTFKVPVCVTRCGNIYGPGDFNFSRIVPDAIRCALNGETLLIRSDGRFTRDYIYIEDIIGGLILLAEKMQDLSLMGEAFNFSCEKPKSVLELVQEVYSIIDKKPRYRILNKVRHEIKHQHLSSIKARRMFKWRPEYTLTEGLKKTIKWYRKIFSDVKK